MILLPFAFLINKGFPPTEANALTGELIWHTNIDAGVNAPPITYMVNGKQYVAVQSGWGVDAAGMTARIDQQRGTRTFVPQGGVVWVFALPD